MYNKDDFATITVKRSTRNKLREMSYQQGKKMWQIAEERLNREA